MVKYFLGKGYLVVTTTTKLDLEIYLKDNNLERFRKDIYLFQLDYKQKNSIKDFVDSVKKLEIRISYIIHNARSLDTLKIQDNGWSLSQDMLDEYKIGVVGPYELTKCLLGTEYATYLKSIIFISSIYGLVGPNPMLYEDINSQSPVQYGLTKSAQIHLTKELAIRLREKGIRVNCVSLGGVKGRADSLFSSRYEKLSPQGRMLEIEDVPGAIEFLINDSSSAITGHNLLVDGGWTLW